jgi:hypothetical protein
MRSAGLEPCRRKKRRQTSQTLEQMTTSGFSENLSSEPETSKLPKLRNYLRIKLNLFLIAVSQTQRAVCGFQEFPIGRFNRSSWHRNTYANERSESYKQPIECKINWKMAAELFPFKSIINSWSNPIWNQPAAAGALFIMLRQCLTNEGASQLTWTWKIHGTHFANTNRRP